MMRNPNGTAILHMSKGNDLDSMGYTSLSGYTMLREEYPHDWHPWVLRDPNGEYVGHDPYRSALARDHGFHLDTGDE